MTKDRLLELLLIFAGGGAGALLRVLMEAPAWGPWMPANFLACLLMGFSSALVQQGFFAPMAASLWKALVHTGFLGGLSTFSVLSIAACVEADGNLLYAHWRLLELLAGFCIAAVFGFGLGRFFVRIFPGAGAR
ncbi:CrcB family protein [Sutterella sp.]|uniref:CrcB family protein n=1 Tax=Sutterella sp. TaxID=1981025 RepID=UPI003FD7A397